MFADTLNVIQLHIPAGQLTPWINSLSPTSYITETAISWGTLNLQASSFPRPLAAVSFCSSLTSAVRMDFYITFKTKHVLPVLFLIEECALMTSFHLCVAARTCCSVWTRGIPARVLRARSQHLNHRGLIEATENLWNSQRWGEKMSLISSSIPSIHSFAALHCQTIVITVMCVSHSRFPHNRQPPRCQQS